MTNETDALERRMRSELPRQLEVAVRPFDAASIARAATARPRPSILRITAVTAVVAAAAVTAVIAVESLSGGGLRFPGGPIGPSPTPRESMAPAAVEQLAAVRRADGIISSDLTTADWVIIVNAHSALVDGCMQDHGWDFRSGVATAETESEAGGALTNLEQWTFADLVAAETTGYGLKAHLAEAAAHLDALDLAGRDAHIPDPLTMSPEDAARFELDFFGREDERIEVTEHDGSHAGYAGGGCLGGAERALYGDIARHAWLRDARDTADSEIWMAALADSAVGNALDRWRSCMRDSSFEIEDPHAAYDAGVDAALDDDFGQESVVATAHARCTTESNLDLAVAAAFLSATNAVLPELETDLRALQRLEAQALIRARDVLQMDD
jgi:hypothetical protein